MGDIRYDRNRSVARSGAQRYGRPVRRHPGRRVMPVWLVVILDLLFLGVALNVFALFHHIIIHPEASEIITLPTRTPVTAPPSPSPSPSVEPTTTVTSDITVEPTLEPTAAIDQGMWGNKFPDKFTSGDVQRTDSSYKSKDLSISITKQERGDTVYFVADIYIRNLENLKTAFGHGKFGQYEATLTQAQNNNAILAINGDNSGSRYEGPVVRNGKLYRDKEFQDVCVMYNDGRVETLPRDKFNLNDIMSNGAWQVWSFGPMLLNDGQPMSSFTNELGIGKENPRSAFGYYEPGHYCFVVVDGRQEGYSTGLSLVELSQLMYDLGCTAAYNLDGGQTSVMVFNGKWVNKPYQNGRSAYDIIYIGEVE